MLLDIFRVLLSEVNLRWQILLALVIICNSTRFSQKTSVPEFIDPVFAKTSPKPSFSVMENERLCKERFDLFSRKPRLYIRTLLLRTFKGSRYTQGFSKDQWIRQNHTFRAHAVQSTCFWSRSKLCTLSTEIYRTFFLIKNLHGMLTISSNLNFSISAPDGDPKFYEFLFRH